MYQVHCGSKSLEEKQDDALLPLGARIFDFEPSYVIPYECLVQRYQPGDHLKHRMAVCDNHLTVHGDLRRLSVLWQEAFQEVLLSTKKRCSLPDSLTARDTDLLLSHMEQLSVDVKFWETKVDKLIYQTPGSIRNISSWSTYLRNINALSELDIEQLEKEMDSFRRCLKMIAENTKAAVLCRQIPQEILKVSNLRALEVVHHYAFDLCYCVSTGLPN